LQVPINVTNLAPPRSNITTKLNVSAITTLISLAEKSEVLCLSNQMNCGAGSPLENERVSKTNSLPSVRR
jgi:hypothetical protein